MNSRYKLLVLTPRYPFPPIGGDRLRIYHVCRYLSSRFELSLLSMCDSPEEMQAPSRPDGIFCRVERVFHSHARKLLGCLQVLPSRTPFQVGYYRNPEFARRLEVLLPQHDGVLAHLIRTGDYLTGYSIPKVLEMTDAISLSYARTRSLGRINPLRSLAYRWEGSRLKPYEKGLIRQFDLSVLVSPVDRDFLQSDTTPKTLVCTNGVDTERLAFDHSPDGKTIVFIGNNTAFHNADAVRWFADAILPRIRQCHPEAVFRVIGRIRKKLADRLARIQGVVVMGESQDIPAAARGAVVGVCPVRFGAGVQNKILEYMSLGVPAVTSPVGLEGLDAVVDQHLLLACTPDEWVSQVCRILSDAALARVLAERARARVEEQYSWHSILEPLAPSILALIETRGGGKISAADPQAR